jgi:hypothetical protein
LDIHIEVPEMDDFELFGRWAIGSEKQKKEKVFRYFYNLACCCAYYILLIFYHIICIMSDFKRQLPTRDANVRFLVAHAARREKMNALQAEIEKVMHFHLLIIVV